MAVHLVGVRQASLRTGPDGPGIALAGQVDVANADTLAAALEAATKIGKRVVSLDLAAVEFLDVAACRALGTAIRRFREGAAGYGWSLPSRRSSRPCAC